MSELFLDTSFAIALAVAGDAHHDAAVRFSTQMERERTRLVTTRAVMIEIGTRYRAAAIGRRRFSY